MRANGIAERLAKVYGAAAYTDYTQFLAHPDLDIVTIATPSGAHLGPAQKDAAAGKHVICEKPLEISLERIDKMIAACQKNKVMLMMQGESPFLTRGMHKDVTIMVENVFKAKISSIRSQSSSDEFPTSALKDARTRSH